MFSRPRRALRARRESLEASFARRSRMARFTPFTEAMEMRSAWCDTKERREWGGYAVRSVYVRSVVCTYVLLAYWEKRESVYVHVLLAYWEKRERGVVFSRPLRALRAA